MRRGNWLSQMENNFKIKSNQKVKQIHVRSKEEKDGKGEKGEGKIHREVSLEKEEKGCQIESEMKREWKEENGESDNDVRKEDDRGEEDPNSQPKAQLDDNAQDKHNPRPFSHSPPAPPSVDDDTSATSLSSSMSLISLIYNKESKRNQFLMSNLSTNNVLVAGPGAPSGHIPRELHVPMPESFNINRKAAGTSPFLFANQPQSYLSYPKKTRPEVPWDSSPPVKYQRHQGQGHGEDGSNGMKRREVCPLRVLMRNYVGDSHSSSSVVASEMLPSVPSRHKNESKEEENAVEDFLCEEPAGTTDQEKGSGNKILSGEWKDLWLCKMKELHQIQHEIHHTDLRELNQLPVCPTPTPSSASSHGNIATGTGERGTNKGRGVTASAEAVAHIFEYLYCLLVGNPSPGYLLHHPNPSSFQLTSCSPTQTPRRKSRQRSAERSSKATSLNSPEKGKEEKEARKLLLKESGPLLAFLQQVLSSSCPLLIPFPHRLTLKQSLERTSPSPLLFTRNTSPRSPAIPSHVSVILSPNLSSMTSLLAFPSLLLIPPLPSQLVHCSPCSESNPSSSLPAAALKAFPKPFSSIPSLRSWPASS
jgi:hypothetical protein